MSESQKEPEPIDPPPETPELAALAERPELKSFLDATSPSAVLRGFWIAAGIILPLICFAIGYPDRPSWQSGNLRDYAALLMTHEASSPLYPLLLGCMAGLAALAGKPERYADNGWVWLGILSGVVLSLEYCVAFQVATGFFMSIIAVPVVSFGVWLAILILKSIPTSAKIVVIVILGAILIGTFQIGFFLLLMCSTPWAVAAYGSAAIWLIRRRKEPWYRFTLAQLLAGTTWFAVHLGAWRASFGLMLAEYHTLPTQAPHDCFVCSTAAKGHRSIVQSESRVDEYGRPLVVNDQLRTLKAFELLLLYISPPLHRALRRVYNRLGPRLAARLGHPLMADAAYLFLKPLEWFARLALRLALGKQVSLIGRLYRL